MSSGNKISQIMRFYRRATDSCVRTLIHDNINRGTHVRSHMTPRDHGTYAPP